MSYNVQHPRDGLEKAEQNKPQTLEFDIYWKVFQLLTLCRKLKFILSAAANHFCLHTSHLSATLKPGPRTAFYSVNRIGGGAAVLPLI